MLSFTFCREQRDPNYAIAVSGHGPVHRSVRNVG
jgi:hypothetical protein